MKNEIIIISTVLIGIIIVIFPNQLKVPQSWKLWSLLPMCKSLLFTFSVQKYIYPSVYKMHAGSFYGSPLHLSFPLNVTHDVQDSGSTGISEDRGWTSSHGSLDFCISLFVASSLTLWEWWHLVVAVVVGTQAIMPRPRGMYMFDPKQTFTSCIAHNGTTKL